MKARWAVGSGRSQYLAWALSLGALLIAPGAAAGEPASISEVKDLPKAATTVQDWMAQVEAATVRVSVVRLERTETGLEIVLETAEGNPLPVDPAKFRAEGNSLIAEIPNTVLALPEAAAFTAENPIPEIANVQVVQQDGSTIQVRVSGKEALPQTAVILRTGELTYSLNPKSDEPEEELVVTGETQEGYRVANTSVGTRTDTPLRDIPASIQIVPQQVLEEQQVNTLNEAIKNVPGATQTAPNYIPGFAGFTIRGFSVGDFGPNVTRNGLSVRLPAGTNAIFSNIERVEVLRGPASVLFGEGDPGGTINIVTKQPQRDPFYSVEATIGSYNLYGGVIDLTSPLNDSKTISYRLNASYQSTESFVDFVETETSAVASALKFEISDNTDLKLDLEYSKINQSFPSGLPAIGSVIDNPNGEIERDRNFSSEDSEYSPEVFRAGYDLEHRFSDNWRLRSAFYYSYLYQKIRGIFPDSLEPDLRTLQRQGDDRDSKEYIFDLFTNVVGKFSTGAIDHQLLFGVDLRKYNSSGLTLRTFQGTPIDIFDPVYSSQRLNIIERPFDDETSINSIGIYL
jgi:iron complex outermembrane recepter protein